MKIDSVYIKTIIEFVEIDGDLKQETPDKDYLSGAFMIIFYRCLVCIL